MDIIQRLMQHFFTFLRIIEYLVEKKNVRGGLTSKLEGFHAAYTSKSTLPIVMLSAMDWSEEYLRLDNLILPCTSHKLARILNVDITIKPERNFAF